MCTRNEPRCRTRELNHQRVVCQTSVPILLTDTTDQEMDRVGSTSSSRASRSIRRAAGRLFNAQVFEASTRVRPMRADDVEPGSSAPIVRTVASESRPVRNARGQKKASGPSGKNSPEGWPEHERRCGQVRVRSRREIGVAAASEPKAQTIERERTMSVRAKTRGWHWAPPAASGNRGIECARPQCVVFMAFNPFPLLCPGWWRLGP